MVEKIKDLCKKNHTTIAKVESATGIGNGIIARWESSSPRVASLSKVADYFGVSLDYLADRTAEQTIPLEIKRLVGELNQAGVDMLKIFAEGLASQEQFRKDTK